MTGVSRRKSVGTGQRRDNPDAKTLVEGCPRWQESGRGDGGHVSRAIFVFNTRNENKRRSRAFVIYARRAASDLSAARPVASNARHYCACPPPVRPKCTFINRHADAPGSSVPRGSTLRSTRSRVARSVVCRRCSNFFALSVGHRRSGMTCHSWRGDFRDSRIILTCWFIRWRLFTASANWPLTLEWHARREFFVPKIATFPQFQVYLSTFEHRQNKW